MKKNIIQIFIKKKMTRNMLDLYRAYLFGSITRKIRPNDVDVVFITKSREVNNAVIKLRQSVRNLSYQFFSIFRVKLSPIVLLFGEWRQLKRKFLSGKVVRLR